MKRLGLFLLSLLWVLAGFSQSQKYLIVTYSVVGKVGKGGIGFVKDRNFIIPMDSIKIEYPIIRSNLIKKIPLYPFLLDEEDAVWGAEYYAEQCLGGIFKLNLLIDRYLYQRSPDLRMIKENRKLFQTVKKKNHIYQSRYLTIKIYLTPVIANICNCQLFCKPNTTLFYVITKGQIQIDPSFWNSKEWLEYVKYLDFSTADYELDTFAAPFIYAF